MYHIKYVILTTRILRVTRKVRDACRGQQMTKQNVTVSLNRQTLHKAKILAARRGSSISGLLAEQIESLVGEEEAYERAQKQATNLLDQGFHLGGVIVATRDEWHER
jgi:hypothetical protein